MTRHKHSPAFLVFLVALSSCASFEFGRKTALEQQLLQQELGAEAEDGDGNVGGMPWFSKARYGYTEVRPRAHMFWYLEPCRHCSQLPATSRPLVIWLQGGPGASGVGFGQFTEVGPFGVGWETRRPAWTDVADVVFLDQPVGTGFSYVDDESLLVTSNDQIAADLVTWFRALLSRYPAFKDQPLHVVCESYGGKMGLGFVKALLDAREEQGQQQHLSQEQKLEFNLQGLALGDSWVSPYHFVASWGPLLRSWSLVDDAGAQQLADLADATKDALARNNGTEATRLWGKVEGTVGRLTDNVNWYNMLQHNIPDDDASSPGGTSGLLQAWKGELQTALGDEAGAASTRMLSRFHDLPSLPDFMNGDFKQSVGIIPDNVTWGGQAGKVFKALAGDFMVPVVDVFDEVLSRGVPITVYEGQLDLICDTVGAEDWMATSAWPGMPAFQRAQRTALYTAAAPQQPWPWWRRVLHDIAPALAGKLFGGDGGRAAGRHGPVEGVTQPGLEGSRAGGGAQSGDGQPGPKQTALFFKRHANLGMYYVMQAGHMVPSDAPAAAMLMLQHMLTGAA